MTRNAPPRGPYFSNPLLLGFDEIERLLDQVSKGGNEGYPPYNIEQIADDEGVVKLRITLAVAGFNDEDLDITVEDKQLVIKGKQTDDPTRTYLHRGIAARQFVRTFVLADGMEVGAANLASGLLSVDLTRTQPERLIKKIKISQAD
ncbi:MAG: Hsp20 family protein [Hyphomicrobiales bacterium]